MRALHDRARELLRRAILTDAALPGVVGPHGYRSSMPEMSPQDRIEAFGHEAAMAYDLETREAIAKRAERFRPTREDISRCNDVLGWLSWLRVRDDEGREGTRIIRLAAFQVPYSRIALKYSVSDETTRRWHVRAVIRIAGQFQDQVEAMA